MFRLIFPVVFLGKIFHVLGKLFDLLDDITTPPPHGVRIQELLGRSCPPKYFISLMRHEVGSIQQMRRLVENGQFSLKGAQRWEPVLQTAMGLKNDGSLIAATHGGRVIFSTQSGEEAIVKF
jgi:hypothetical protein